MDSFIGQIQIFGFGYAPRGWALCDGSKLNITQNVALFSLIGSFYGGDGRTTFALPDLRGRATYGAGYSGQPAVASTTGATTVTLDQTQIAAHTHNLMGTTQPGSTTTSSGNAFATTGTTTKTGQGTGFKRYSTNAANTAMAQGSLVSTGNGQPHNNMQPYLGMNYYICLQGVFPLRP